MVGREWVWEYSNACDGRTLFNISFVLLGSGEINGVQIGLRRFLRFFS